MSIGDGSFSTFSIYVNSDWSVRCSHYPDQSPILSVDAGESSFTVSIRGRKTDQAAVEFARALVREAQAFADDLERLHAESAALGSTGPAERAA